MVSTTDRSAQHNGKTVEGGAALRALANSKKPPKAIFKVMNPIMKTILKSPLHGRASDAIVLLTFKGRKSGKVMTVPVGYHRDGADLLLFTHSPWFHNFVGGAPVKLLLKGERKRGYGEAIEEPEVVFTKVMEVLERIGRTNIRRLGIMLDTKQEPTDEELRTASAGTVLVRIRVEG